MNTGKTYLNIFLTVGVAVALSSCGGQDEIYKEWVKKGGYDYPAKAINLSSVIGYKSVIINWEKPMDPAVTTATLFWDNYASSQSIDYADYPDGKVSMGVGNLEDRSYTFDIVNYDAVGNKSLAAEITVSPYGDSWMVSRSERTVTSARMDGRDAKIVMSKATDEMVATRFRYKNLQDEWVECETILKPGENEVTFPNALRGKRFEYSSSFCPAAGKDTVWSHWTKSVDGISYALDGKRWNVAVTKNQYFGINVADNIFDGNKDLSAFSWHSSKSDATKNIFPKILSVDTQKAFGEEYSFTRFEFYEHPDQPTLRYIKDIVIYVGSTYYDPDDNDYLNHYGIPFIGTQFSTEGKVSTASATQGASGRYFSIVFKNSWNTKDGFIDLWELVPYGYIPSQAD
uniref:DUF4998 domain-containing protein n=1 Tax=Candidatus Cryptobacteroides bacterium TaxID=3085639 RepID=UPI0040288150